MIGRLDTLDDRLMISRQVERKKERQTDNRDDR